MLDQRVCISLTLVDKAKSFFHLAFYKFTDERVQNMLPQNVDLKLKKFEVTLIYPCPHPCSLKARDKSPR